MVFILYSVVFAVLFYGGLKLGGFEDSKHVDDSPELNVYCARKEELIKPVFDEFTRQYGVRVNYLIDDAPKLISRMVSEGENTKADVFLTADVMNLDMANQKGLLQPIESAILESRIPSELRSDSWFALTKRASIIVYNKNYINSSQLSNYEDLANPKWKGKILLRSSASPYMQSLISSFIHNHGLENAEKWAIKVVSNLSRSPHGGDTDQIRAVSSGIGQLAVVNSYYYARLLASSHADDIKVVSNVMPFFPNQSDRGTLINISGGGVVKNAKHKDSAVKLLEFMVSTDAQQIYAQMNQEYPVVSGVQLSPALQDWGDFKKDYSSLKNLYQYSQHSMELADKAGWR